MTLRGFLVIVLCAGVVAAASVQAAPTAVRAVGCSQRFERALPWPIGVPGTIAVGPVLFTGLRSYARRIPSSGSDGWRFAKTPTAVRAGALVTLSIAPRDRAWARLIYGDERAASITIAACPADTPRFTDSSQTVGPWTGFAGGFLLRRAGCVHATLAVEGESTRTFHVSLGRACARR